MIDFNKINMKRFLETYCEGRKNDFSTLCIYSKDCVQGNGIGCEQSKHPDNVAKRAAEAKARAREIHIEAYDKGGKKYDKVVTTRDHPDRQDVILSFGWPCEYGVASLLEYSYPLKADLCIDAGGRNHNGKGHAVYVKKEDVNRIVKEVVDNYWHH